MSAPVDLRVRDLIRRIALNAVSWDESAPIVEFFVDAPETLCEIGRLFAVPQNKVDEIVDEAHAEAHAASKGPVS